MAKVSFERIPTEMERHGSHSREEEEEQCGRANRDRRTDRCTSVASSSEWCTTYNATLWGKRSQELFIFSHFSSLRVLLLFSSLRNFTRLFLLFLSLYSFLRPLIIPFSGKSTWLTIIFCVSISNFASSCTRRSVSYSERNSGMQTHTNVVRSGFLN